MRQALFRHGRPCRQRGSHIVEYAVIAVSMIGVWAAALQLAAAFSTYFEDYGWGLVLPL